MVILSQETPPKAKHIQILIDNQVNERNSNTITDLGNESDFNCLKK